MTTLCLTFWLLTSCVVSVSPRRWSHLRQADPEWWVLVAILAMLAVGAAILVAHVIAEYHTP